jgi:hypothetical protein
VGGAATLAKVVVAVVVVAAATAGTVGIRRGEEHAQGRIAVAGAGSGTAAMPVHAATTVASAIPAASVVPSSVSSVARPPSRPAQTHTPVTTAPIVHAPQEPVAPSLPPPDRTAQELALIQQMQAALRAGDPAGALALVREHERRFADSQLAPEREGARVIALCMDAPRDRAAELGRAFVDGHARSPLTARVRATCGLDGTNDFDTGRGPSGQ